MRDALVAVLRDIADVRRRVARLESYDSVTATGSIGSVWNEIPSGDINGTNTTFTLAHAPTSGTLRLYLNGLRLREGSSYDYTLSGNTITMTSAPQAGDYLLADYVYT